MLIPQRDALEAKLEQVQVQISTGCSVCCVGLCVCSRARVYGSVRVCACTCKCIQYAYNMHVLNSCIACMHANKDMCLVCLCTPYDYKTHMCALVQRRRPRLVYRALRVGHADETRWFVGAGEGRSQGARADAEAGMPSRRLPARLNSSCQAEPLALASQQVEADWLQ